MSLADELFEIEEKAKLMRDRLKFSDEDYKEYLKASKRDLVKDTITDLVNLENEGFDVEDALVTGIHQSHRYLQSEFITSLWRFLGKYGEMNDVQHTDGRNEHAKKSALRMYGSL